MSGFYIRVLISEIFDDWNLMNFNKEKKEKKKKVKKKPLMICFAMY